jgi:hypothetical protein
VHTVNKQGAGGLTYTLGPTSLLEFRMGITNTIGGKWPLQLGLPDMQKRIRAGDGDRIAVLMTSAHKILCTTSPKPATSYEAGVDFRRIPPGTEQPRRGSTQRVSGAKRPGSVHNSGESLSYPAAQALAPETEALPSKACHETSAPDEHPRRMWRGLQAAGSRLISTRAAGRPQEPRRVSQQAKNPMSLGFAFLWGRRFRLPLAVSGTSTGQTACPTSA